MKVLLVCPEYPETFWSFKYALQFTDRKAALPPLGLLTVASMLPKEWEKKLVDLNIDPLKDEQLEWADYVFVGAIDIQRKSAIEVINRCNELGAKVVAGGPLFAECHDDFETVDHIFLGEAETTIPEFLEDLEKGTTKHLYMHDEFPDIEKATSPPLWELVDMKKYQHLSIQFSRGCPFDCEFCQITKLFGRKVRTKSKEQIINELDLLYNLGWRSGVFFVDDNIIGNKHKLKTEILSDIIEWSEKRNYPFSFSTQASINLADDEKLMRMMVRAGFDSVCIGIESIDDDCLVEAGKFHNRKRDLVASVKKMQQLGLEVKGGFIVGFDNEKESNFDRMIEFLQESGIVIAMVGILSVAKGTKLYNRLKEENRLISEMTGDNTDFTLNFIPKMDRELLLEGYKKILKNIYSPEQYYKRMHTFLRNYNPGTGIIGYNISYANSFYSYFKTIIKVTIGLGILDEGRIYYWKLLFWTLFRYPPLLPYVIMLWAEGYHLRKIFGIQLWADKCFRPNLKL